MNYQDIQIDFSYEIRQIQELSFTSGYGDHPVAQVKGIVDEDKQGELIKSVNGETPFTIRKKDGKVLFTGFVSEIRFAKEGGLYYFYLTAKGTTAKLDILKRSRTFFKKGITYQEIVERVLNTYPGASLISHVDLSKQTEFPIIQYKETDWEFLLRIASMFGASIRSFEYSEVPGLEIGYEAKPVEADLKVTEVETERDLLTCEKEFYGQGDVFTVTKEAGQEAGAADQNTAAYPDVLNYTTEAVHLREYYPVGTLLRINGAELAVSYVEGYLEKGELYFDHIVRLPEGIRSIYQDNPALPGASLTGTVKKCVGNTVSLTLDIDLDDGAESDREDYFFAYAIETKDYYCMPVEGAKVHLYFPTGKEWDAIAVHSLRNTAPGAASAETTSDPSNRSLSDPTGASVNLSPAAISMTPDNGRTVNMKLGADGVVEISAADIMICGQDINIGKGEDSAASNVSLSAGDIMYISMMRGGEEGAVPAEDHFVAIQGVAQLYSPNSIYHETSGGFQPVTPTYDDAELLEQERNQKEANNKQVANTLIQRNREARAKFGKGLLMAALGAALIVAATGPLAVLAIGVGIALSAFAAADMAEATQSHELAMEGDWSTPAENVIKNLIPDPFYSLIENGLIIAGSLLFAGPMAGKMLTGAIVNTGVDLAFDLIPDGKLDKSVMEYLDSFSTNLMISSLTGPITKMDGCSGPMANFEKQFLSGFTSSTLGGIAQGELSFEGMAENMIREGLSAGISTKVGFTMEGKNKWLVAGVDTLSDTVFDTGSQLVDIALGRQESFDWQRCLKTAVTSGINNWIMACDPVNAARGNLLIYKEELVFAGLYGMEKWFRRYDSMLDHDGAFGKGWIHAFESFLIAEPVSGTLDEEEQALPKDIESYQILVMLPDTHKEKFVWRNGGWTPEKESAPYRFRMKEDGTFLLEEWQEEKYQAYYYDHHGRLTALKKGRNTLPIRIFYVEQEEAAPKGFRSVIDHVEYPGGQRLDFTYRDGYVASVKDHAGREIQYHYKNDRLDHVCYPTGGCQEYTYDAYGHITELKGEDGRDFMTNAYDKRGRVVRQSYPDGSSCQIQYVDNERKTVFWYSDSGRQEINYYNDKDEVVRREYGGGIFETMEYDDYGNKISETDRNGSTTRYRYDQNGHLIEKTFPEGLVVCYAYDEAGRLIQESDNTGASTGYTYDSDGQLVEKSVQTDVSSFRRTTYTRDRYGRLLTVTDALGNTTKYLYEDDIFQPSEIQTAEGYVIRYRYDKAGRRTGIITDYGEKELAYSETEEVSRETDALGNTTRYLRDSVGNLLKLIRPNDYDESTDNGEGIYYEYDYLDRLTGVKYPDGSVKKLHVNMDGTVLSENLLPVKPGDEEKRATVYRYDGRQYRMSASAPDGGVTAYERDGNGNLLKTILPESYRKDGQEGAGLQYTYDKENRLTAILDDRGRAYRTYLYDLKGRLKEVREGQVSRGTRYVYDLAGQLVEKWVPVREKEGVLYNVTLYAYDAAGNRILERRSGEEVREGEYPSRYLDIRMSYDKQNRLVRVEDGLGAAAEYTYDCLNQCLTEKYRVNDDKYRLICYTYDAAGRLVERMESVDLPDVGEDFHAYRKKEYLRTKYELDKNGNIVGIHLPNGGKVSRTYDCLDRLLTETLTDAAAGLNRTTAYAYDASGKVISRRVYGADCQEMQETTYRYDICGRLIAETDAAGGTTRYVLDNNGNVVKAINPDQYQEQADDGDGYRFAYDIFGRLEKVWNAEGSLIEQNSYDSAGRLLSKRDSTGILYRSEYDLGGRRTDIYTTDNKGGDNETYGNGENGGASPVQSYTYDSLGNITGVTDGEQNRTTFRLDAWGRITELQKPDGSRESYTYDHAGNVTSTTDGNGNTIQYRFNSMGKTERIIDQAGAADTFSYDHEGNPAKHTDRNGRTVVSTYGSFGLLLSERGGDGTFRTRKYNGLGQLVENASSCVTYRYDYDKPGRVRTKYIGGRAALTYTYTKGGKIASITDISGKTTRYGYDRNGRLIRVSEDGRAGEKVLVTYEYDGIGRLTDIRFANGIHTGYTYDCDRNLAALKTEGADGSILLSYTYRYDRNGNRTEKTDANGNATVYTYDSLQRLSEVSSPTAGTEKYIFDAAGNRIEKQVFGTGTESGEKSYTEQYRYDERNRMLESARQSSDGSNSDVTRYTYDAQGSLLSEEGTCVCRKYLYNDFHQCVTTEVIRRCEEEAERTAGVSRNRKKEEARSVQENLYDGDGLRYAIIENGRRTSFITNGWENLVELDEAGEVKKRIIRGAGIAASEEDNAYHYYHGNERMDVEWITDEEGGTCNRYRYDAFGSITDSEETIENRYTYSGEAYDRITGQYYLRKRFYNPAVCRFTQEDEYRGDGLNLYAFCANNPVMYVDPSGYGSVTYNERPIIYNGQQIGTVSYKTGEYLEISVNSGTIPNTTNGSGWNLESESLKDINRAYRKGNSLERGKEIENIIAAAVINDYIQIGNCLDGKFPVIDLANFGEVVSIKSLNEYCTSYRLKDENGKPMKTVDTDAVVDQIMKYYNQIDGISITINGKEVNKELLVSLNGTSEYSQEIKEEIRKKVKEKIEEIEGQTKCSII